MVMHCTSMQMYDRTTKSDTRHGRRMSSLELTCSILSLETLGTDVCYHHYVHLDCHFSYSRFDSSDPRGESNLSIGNRQCSDYDTSFMMSIRSYVHLHVTSVCSFRRWAGYMWDRVCVDVVYRPLSVWSLSPECLHHCTKPLFYSLCHICTCQTV